MTAGRYAFPLLCWVFFLLAAMLTALVVPVGEGFDEPWHMGYVQYVATTGALPPSPHLRLSREMQEFLEIGPVGTVLDRLYPKLQSHDSYWMADPETRNQKDTRARNLRFSAAYVEADSGFEQYESHQPPLYYLLCAPVFKLWTATSLPSAFLLVRIWSVLIASTLIPLTFLLSREVSQSVSIANAATLLTAMFPGIYPDLVRVSNDALAVPLATAACLMLARYVRTRSTRDAGGLGLILLTGLATKAFFIPIFGCVLLNMLMLRAPLVAGSFLALTLPGWIFYIRNATITGSFTGLPETVQAQTSVVSSFTVVLQIDWIGVIRLAAATHIWTGFWSLLPLRSWMHQTVFCVFLLASAGFVLHLLKSKHATARVLSVLYITYLLALMYYATQTFQSTTQAIIQGWYITPFVAFEACVFTLGVAQLLKGGYRTAAVSIAAFALLALLIYGTLFVAAPYYTGFTSHAPSGHLRPYSPAVADIPIISARAVRLFPLLPTLSIPVVSLAVLSLGLSLIAGFVKKESKRPDGPIE
ncbi:MAG TPA: hypothetical protein VFR18_13130 [Terriglobia bacterium]|nr:hypothetical protein [Terriglobia bacterium]